MVKKLKRLNFYKNIWFWIALVSVVYILTDNKLLKFSLIFEMIVYVYSQIIEEPIAFLALGISIFTVYIERINVVKNDRRAPLSVSYEIEERTKVEAQFGHEKKNIKVPKLRIYENSGVIIATYMLTPYVNNHDLYSDTLADDYFSFNAVHIHINELTNSFRPAKLHKEHYFVPRSFIANNPNDHKSHFIFELLCGIDGTYKLLMLVYRKKQIYGTTVSDDEYTLEVIDRVDALNIGAVYNQVYYNQFKKCEKYLRENGIIIS